MPVYEYNVEMTCDGCSNALNRILERQKSKGIGIEKYQVDLATKKVTVDSNLSAQEVMEILQKSGKGVTLLTKE